MLLDKEEPHFLVLGKEKALLVYHLLCIKLYVDQQ